RIPCCSPSPSSVTIGTKSCPLAPRPCNHITLAVAFRGGWISTQSSMLSNQTCNQERANHFGYCKRNEAYPDSGDSSCPRRQQAEILGIQACVSHSHWILAKKCE